MPKGSKVVIFSAYYRTLTLLKDALVRKYNNDTVAFVGGSDTAKDLTTELARFRHTPQCAVLLLDVRMCANGLTLTAADHCFLIEPQEDEATEVQLINRIYRIGQERPVVIKKYAMRGTIEERRLTHRKSAGGLLNDETDQMGAMATQTADKGEDSAQVGIDLHRLRTLRFLAGLE